MEKRDGFIPVYLNDRTGAILARDSARFDARADAHDAGHGLGSNPIGLDRGSGGGEQVARFERSADRVLVIFENTQYRSSGGADHLRTVLEAFPPSTVAALPIVAEEGGRILVDATDFVMRDWNDVAATLQRSQQGAYVGRARSLARVQAVYESVSGQHRDRRRAHLGRERRIPVESSRASRPTAKRSRSASTSR